ncbi:RNA polymerase II transcription factor SIII subunit A-domain-containing protein [Microdochium trichocladiopsis]|uniref:RNA polymerase II transcription factor SIII subunit A-domain-containing protein n=1 Tax=Microdochium trichocladiopsis TaxID=1682393 RepID=A0A9P9BN51_9PEZI|nr:RNA polymerase II transcription factor SIII subunit A-domain-containing protein [Microdochium trichocladiopsis]KAH7027341.1 RNA polymerase II transcription factor SIII subunit A-domain-containing protein [Microdochium trichocladiopsis]
MPTKSLFELCTVVCLKHIKEITDIGLTPYPAVRRILLNINSASQLRQLELASPHLEGDDAECWIRLIDKDFPVLSKKHNFEPRNPASWHKVYSKYQRLEEETKRAAEEKLKSAFAGINKEKASKTSSVVDFDRRKLPKLPKDGRGLAGVRRVKGQPVASTNGLRFTGGTKTKVTDAKSIMRKARREAAAIGARNRLDTNSANLRRDQLQQAPKGLVNEYKLKARPVERGMPSAGGRIATGIMRPPVPSVKRIDRDLEEREARLRKMTSLANTRRNTTVVSDDELDDEEDIGHIRRKPGAAVITSANLVLLTAALVIVESETRWGWSTIKCPGRWEQIINHGVFFKQTEQYFQAWCTAALFAAAASVTEQQQLPGKASLGFIVSRAVSVPRSTTTTIRSITAA